MGRFRDFLSWLGEHFEIIDSSDDGLDVLKDTGSIGDFALVTRVYLQVQAVFKLAVMKVLRDLTRS